MAIKYLIPALAAISTAYAACSISSTTTIVNPAGASALATCTTFKGDIVMATGVAEAGTVDISGVEKIDGSLTYENDNSVTTFKANQLQSIGDLTLTNLSQLSTLSMPALTTVGKLDLQGLDLSKLGFGTPGIKSATSIRIINTNIDDLTGVDRVTKIGGIIISDNQFLSEVNFSIDKVTNTLEIDSNDKNNGGQSVSCPNLVSAGAIIIRNSSSLSIPKLSGLAGTLGIYGNTFSGVSFPKLSYAGAVVMNDNTKLTNTSFPMLFTINGTNSTFQIANNTLLTAITGFPLLENVDGNVNLYGNFSKVDLPKLDSVTGALDVETSSNTNVCPDLVGLGTDGSQVVRGAVTCNYAESDPGSASSTSTATGDSAGSPSEGAAVGNVKIPISLALGGTSIFAGILQFLL